MIITLLALVVTIGLSAGQSYGDNDYLLPKYIPIGLVADQPLDELLTYLDNLEVRETAQLNKLDALVRESNLNSEFANRFNEVIHQNFQFHQKQQNQRLDDLENRMDEIEALRARTRDLQNATATINDQVNTQVYPDRKQIQYDLDHLRNLNLEFNADLEETDQRANAVNDNIDILFEKSWSNSRQLLALDNGRKQLTQEVNVQTVAVVDTADLFPGNENATATLNFVNPVLGAPHFSDNSIIGFHAVRERRARSPYQLQNQYQYQNQYQNQFNECPSLYFGVYTTICDAVNVTATDMGSGGWTTSVVVARIANVYFSAQQLTLKPVGFEKSDGKAWRFGRPPFFF